jgi:predicted MPP superfamily phosphohydrolase
MARTLFSWIHLSDIHFGHGAPSDRYDQKMVLRRLRRDLDDARGEGAPQKPDAILVTGDIAFSGDGVVRPPDKEAHEYKDATKWLLDVAQQVGLGPAQVFVVPGNHDVNRGADRRFLTDVLVSALRKGDREIDAALADAEACGLLSGRMGAYLAFASQFAPACIDKREGQLFWVHPLERNGLKVRLVGLNTSLLCAGEDDRGKLRLGKQQLHEALGEPPAKGELVIVLSHHPLRVWLEDGDARGAEALIMNDAHVHLSGHVHEAESSEVRGGGARGGAVRVVAGAVHNERQPASWIPAGHGYNWGEVVEEGGKVALRIRPRQWSDGNADYRLDVDRVPRGGQYAEHPLSIELSKPRVPAAKQPGYDRSAAPNGIEVFYFYAAEDEAEQKKLHRALASLWNVEKTIFCASRQSVADAGGDYAAEIEQARIFLVLLSNDFLASSELGSAELARALERSRDPSVLVIPIYLKESAINDHPTWGIARGKTGLPPARDSTELSWIFDGGPADAKLKQVAEGLRAAVERLRRS